MRNGVRNVRPCVANASRHWSGAITLQGRKTRHMLDVLLHMTRTSTALTWLKKSRNWTDVIDMESDARSTDRASLSPATARLDADATVGAANCVRIDMRWSKFCCFLCI